MILESPPHPADLARVSEARRSQPKSIRAVFGDQKDDIRSPSSLSLSLCHTVLPFIVHELLLQNCPDIRLVLSAKFCIFFREHFEAVTSVPRSTTGPQLAHLREDSVASLLSVVTYMREQPLPHHLKASAREQNCWEQNFWLANINYLHCAQVLQTVKYMAVGPAKIQQKY